MRLTFLTSLIVLLSISTAVIAGQGQIEFSADVDQSMPQQKSQQSKIYIGNGQMRTDITVNGKTMIQIIDMKQQTAYMLDPEQHTYMVRKAGPGEMMPGGVTAKDANPCAGMQNLSCTRLGVEDVNGRPAEKWEMVNTARGQSGKMVVWLDQERHMPVRQTLPDGSTMEMRLVGRETLNGRTTEKWEMTVTRPGGQKYVVDQWFDPELKMNIREERPDGFVSEFRNIKIGKQPADLFTVPADYKEVSIPQGGGSEPGQGIEH
jgi:Domain of unknown function (DUF4412)